MKLSYFLLILLLLQNQYFFTKAHSCEVDSVKLNLQWGQAQQQQDSEKKGIALDQSKWNSIRIKADISGLSKLSDSTVKQNIIDMTLVAIDFFTLRLKVQRLTSPITLSSQCQDYQLPSYPYTIQDADLVLFLTFEDSLLSSSYLALAVPCAMSSDGLDRPIAGQIKFNFKYLKEINFSDNKKFQSSTSIVLHEMIHILGFHKGLFDYWKTKEGIQYNMKTFFVTNNFNGKDFNFLATPEVRKRSASYFGCDTIVGVALENQGGDGTIGSHWEKSMLMDELMTGNQMPNMFISDFTLALLEDTGWYSINYKFTDKLVWLRNRQCTQFYASCQTQNAEYCTNSNNYACSYDNNNFGICINKDTLTDPCSYYYPTGYDATKFDCRDSSNAVADTSLTGQLNDQSSRCFVSTIKNVGSSLSQYTYNQRCYQTSCYYTTQIEIQIKVGSQYVTCTASEGGTTKTVLGYDGYITCPTNLVDFCDSIRKPCPNHCSKRGVCIQGMCSCKLGYSGVDCQSSSCPSGQYLQGSVCVGVCSNGYFLVEMSGTCQQCHSTCATCNGLEFNNCLTCSTYGYKVQDGICVQNCDNLHTLNIGSNCYKKCPARYYQSSYSCYSCHYTCETCSGPADNQCTSCSGGLFLLKPGSCIAQCPSGSMPNVKYECDVRYDFVDHKYSINSIINQTTLGLLIFLVLVYLLI